MNHYRSDVLEIALYSVLNAVRDQGLDVDGLTEVIAERLIEVSTDTDPSGIEAILAIENVVDALDWPRRVAP